MDKEQSLRYEVIRVNCIVSIVSDFLQLRNHIPNKIHVFNTFKESYVLDKEPILMIENFLFDIWGKLIGQSFNLNFQELLLIIVDQIIWDFLFEIWKCMIIILVAIFKPI